MNLEQRYVIQWACQVLSGNCVILDTETTGLDSSAEVVQIAILDMSGNVLRTSYIRPVAPIDEESEAFYINNISQEMVKGAPTFPEIFPSLCEVLNGKIVLAYNAEFDRRILGQDCVRYGLKHLPVCGWECLLTAYSTYRDEYTRMGKLKRHSLTNACAHMGLLAPDHTATGDAAAILRLLTALSKEGEE